MDSLSKSAWCSFAVFMLFARTVTAETAKTEFQVEAYHASDLAHRHLTYRIAPSEAAHGPVLQEALQASGPAMAALGFVVAPPGTKADVEIILSLEVTERVKPRTRYSRRFRPVTHHVRTLDVVMSDEEGNETVERQQVVIPADNGYRAVSVRPSLTTLYEKRFVMAAREVNTSHDASRVPRELWRVIVTNEDAQDDVAAYARIMVSVAIDFIGQRADGRTHVIVPGRRVASVAN